MTTQTAPPAHAELATVEAFAATARRAATESDHADHALHAAMRQAQQAGASLSAIAHAAGCSKTWAKRCVDAHPGQRP